MKYWSMVAFASLFFSYCGWGYILVRYSTLRSKVSLPFLAVTGIAFLTFLGGVLNLARLAYPMTLSVLFYSGLLFFVIHSSENLKMWIKKLQPKKLRNTTALKDLFVHTLPTGFLIIAVIFYAFTLLPTAAFNYVDDFMAYIPRPLRMLQTGTMTGDPFELLGLDLGGHAFHHGFILLNFSIEYLVGFDAVFGFCLTGMLLLSIGKKFDLHWSHNLLAILAFIVINPQAVNISAIYIGSAIILGGLYASCHLFEQFDEKDNGINLVLSAGILGLLLASSIAIKTSFFSYAFAYIIVLFFGLFLISKNKNKVIKAGGIVILSAFLALLPWFVLHAANYKPMLQRFIHSTDATPTAALSEFSLPLKRIASLFSNEELVYGGSFLGYGVIVLMLFIAFCYSLYNATGFRATPTQRGYLLVSLASCLAGIVGYFFNALYTIPESAVRYSSPVLIAALPFAWLASSISVKNIKQPVKANAIFNVKSIVMTSMLLLVVSLFFSNFITRIERAYYQHMTLSFPTSPNYLVLIRHTISPDAGQLIRQVQLHTQPAQKILALVDMPSHFDFSRNEIYSAGNPHGLESPWINMPFNESPSDMTQFLKGLGIRYIIWEYQDNFGKTMLYQTHSTDTYADRSASQKALYLREMLTLIMRGRGLLYNANGIALFDLQQVN